MFFLMARRAVACVAGGSFRASPFGLRLYFSGLGVCWLMFKFVFSFGASWVCLHRGRLVWGVASRTASLLLRFGGVWVDAEFCFLFWHVVLLPASKEARVRRRLSAKDPRESLIVRAIERDRES